MLRRGEMLTRTLPMPEKKLVISKWTNHSSNSRPVCWRICRRNSLARPNGEIDFDGDRLVKRCCKKRSRDRRTHPKRNEKFWCENVIGLVDDLNVISPTGSNLTLNLSPILGKWVIFYDDSSPRLKSHLTLHLAVITSSGALSLSAPNESL